MARADVETIQADIDDELLAQSTPSAANRYGQWLIGVAAVCIAGGVLAWLWGTRHDRTEWTLTRTLVFCGFAAVVAIIVWAVQRDVRKQVDRAFAKRPLLLGELDMLGETEWRFDDQSAVFTNTHSELRVPSSHFDTVEQHHRSVCIKLLPLHEFRLPKSAFPSQADCDQFCTALNRLFAQHRNPDVLVRGYLLHERASCPSCGYELSGSGSGACPECGRKYPLENFIERDKVAFSALISHRRNRK